MVKLYNGNGGEVEITPSDDSYRLKELMGADEVVLKFALPDYLAISTGAYITYKGDRYEVESEDSVRMIHTEEYEYTVTFSSPRAHLRRYIVREKGGEGRITFFLTAKPREHLDLIVHNLNEREAGWAVGACIDGSEKTIEYSTTNALDALAKLAEAYGTEWECEGRTLSLRKSEYHKDSPLTVSYGKGKGLLSGLERNPAEEQPVGTLYVTGTDRNIDPAKYKSKTLHLPKGGTKTVGGRTYTVTSGGRAITVSGSAPGAVEGAFTDTDIYPSREGVVGAVTVKDKEKAFVDFTDPTIPADLDFEQCLIPGREMKLTFQSGMLAGRTFGAKYVHKDRRFEIVPEEIDGVLMPSAPYLPKEGDRYGVFEIALPESYIRSAEERLLDSAVQYLEGLETSRYSYRAAVDPLWLKKQWTKVGHKVRIGAYVRLAGDPITDGGATLRITRIKEYLTDPYAPEVTLSDRATGRGGLTSIIRKAVQDDLTSTREASTRTAVEQARRTFHKAEQLTDALEKALGAHFDAMVRPLAVHTMQVLVGDKSLQFAYVESPSSTKEVPLPLTFDTVTKSLHIDQAYLQHKTLGVQVTTAHTAKDFRTWTIAPIDYSPKGTAPLYLYARVPREGDGGTFVIDTKAHDFDEEAGYYHLWSGMLTPTDDGRSWEYMPMHGFTEITPGMISSPRFTSPDGRLVIDMVRGYFRFKTDKSTFSINADNPNGVYIRGGMTSVGGQNLTLEEAFEEQERKLKAEAEARAKAEAELEEALEGIRQSTGDEQAAMAEILGKVNKTLTSLQEQVDKEVSNWFYPGPPAPDKEPEKEWVTNQDKYRHIGDTYTSVDESGEYMGKSWRYTPEYKWQEIHDTLISKALAVAAKAQTTADGKSTTYYTQPSRYSVGDSWVLSADTTVGGKVYKKGTMLFANSSSDVYVGSHWSDILKYIDSAKLEADLRESERKSKEAWEAYATAKADKAGEDALKAAKEHAEAQDAAYEARTKAYADKILTEKEQALIAAADAKANLAEKRAKAYADGKITDTEQLAIDKAAAAYKAAVAKAKELDSEIQVGGRNLAIEGEKKERISRGLRYINLSEPLQKDTSYTLSFDVEVHTPPADRRFLVYLGYSTHLFTSGHVQYADGATHYSITLHTPDKEGEYSSDLRTAYLYPHGWRDGYNTVTDVTFSRVKLERGTVATDWTPAPEDIQAEIDAINANPPRINAKGTWEVYVPKEGKYIDTGRTSKGDNGKAPIVKDGNWWEYDPANGDYTDTGVKAIGEDAQNVRPNILRVRDIINPFNLPYDEKKKAFIIYPHDKGWRTLKASNDDIVAGKSLVYSYTLRNKSDVGYDVTHPYNRRADGKGLNDLIKPGETVRIYMHRTDDYSSFILNYNKAFSPTKGYIEVSEFKVEEVREGELPIPTAYIPHPDDLKGDGLEVIDTRADNQPPSWYRKNYPRTTVKEFKSQSTIKIPSEWQSGTYCTLETTVRYSDTSGGRVEQSTTLDNGVQLRRVGTADDTAWEPWINVSAEIDAAKEQATKAQTSTDKLRGYVDGAFRDGIVDDAEAKAIKTYINEVDAQWQSALGAYEKVYQNPLLTGTPKTALLDCKTTLAGKCDDLTQYIATAIGDGKATAAEVSGVNSRYNAYKVALKDFQKALKEAEDFIRSKGSGGRFLGEATSLGFDGGVQLASGQFVYGKAGDTVRMTNTGSNNVTSWKKGKIYILVLTTDKGYELLVWEQLTGKDGAPGRDGRDGVDGKDGAPGKDADPAEIRELKSGLANANTSISALQDAKEEIENGKLSASDLPAHLKWIYDAFNEGETIKEGGLVLTQIIGLSNIDGKITAYLSGRNAKGAHMLAAGVTSLADTDAVSYINYDGTAKFGGVKINRDSIYIDADDSGSGIHQVVHDRLYITRSGIFAYLDSYIRGGLDTGVFKANYEQGFHSKRVSIGDGGTSVIQVPRGNSVGLKIDGNMHVFGDKMEYNGHRVVTEGIPRTHDMQRNGGSVSLTKEDTSVLIANEALSSAHCTITLPDAGTVKSGWRCTVTTMGAVVDGSITFKTKYSSQKMFWGSDRQVSTSHNYAEKSNIIVALRISDQNTNNGTVYWFVKEIRAY